MSQAARQEQTTKVELVRPEGEKKFGDIVVMIGKNEERFGPGERIILVNGERWGRTHVTRHGCWGTKYTFYQDGDGTITEPTGFKARGSRETRDVEVKSIRKRTHKDTDWRPTEELVREKAFELVRTGKLRHPDVVRREAAKRAERWEQRQAEIAAQEAETFRAKAMQALQINDPTSDDPRIAAVVEAMRWAQSQ